MTGKIISRKPYDKNFSHRYALPLESKNRLGWDSSVGIASCYGLDRPGIESRWGARFSTPVQTGPGAYQASYTMGTGSFPGGKAAGAWR